MGTLQFKRVTQSVELIPFDCGIASINNYVKSSYYPTIVQHAYAYSVMYGDKILGYYMVHFRDIEIDGFPEEISDYNPGVKDDKVSAVHIKFIAIDEKYQGKKIGTSVLKIIIKNVEELANSWPIRIITIDARSDLVEWYKRQGFEQMKKNTPGQDGVTEAMYYDCMKFADELAEYTKNVV